MKMKLSKKCFDRFVEINGSQLMVSTGYFGHFKCGRHTKSDFVLENISTADVELFAGNFGTEGIRIAGHDRVFRPYDDPCWRE